MKRLFSIVSIASIATIATIALSACQPKNEPETPDTPGTPADTTVTPSSEGEGGCSSSRTEQYRPQVHYTVHHNWMNDPNGLCYKDGTWHLYYQYNPNGTGCDFGGMSWGHATSTDLMHWAEQEPVLYPDDMGAMFSGCSVVDTENRAGFGAGAILAYYTASSDKQKICLAVSTDGGMHFDKYAGNPIVPSTGLANFRDPKVVWDEAHQQYVMVIAKGWDQGLEFWRSTNLKDWHFVPYIFHAAQDRCNHGQYECPDMVQFGDKWVLILSTMPGGYINGSGTMYFVGSLTAEGYFVCDEDPMVNGKSSNGKWLDYGADNYAAVSWNNTPDNRSVAIGWMNNWDYAPACPPSVWKSAFTLPREYSLREIEGEYVLCSNPVAELETLAGDWVSADSLVNGKLSNGKCLEAYELRLTVSLSEDAAITLSNAYGEQYEVRIDSRCRKIISDRSRAGESNFSSLFAVPSMAAPIWGTNDEVELCLIVDHSSVELFADQGATCVTNTVYPRALYNTLHFSGQVHNARFRPLQTIW